MDGMLPPVDTGGWLNYQRRRAQQFARERIARAGQIGQVGGDWLSRAGTSLDNLLPDWAKEEAPRPNLPQITPPPSPSLSEGNSGGLPDWARSASDRIGQIGSDLGGVIDQAQGILPGGEAWNADLERIRREREASEARFPQPEPGPTGMVNQTGTPEGEAITSALAETAQRETPGGQFATNMARRAAGPASGPMTADTPVQNLAGMAGLAFQNVGAPLPGGRAIGAGLLPDMAARAATEAIPGGETSVLEGAQIPEWVPGLGGQRLTKDTPVLGGLTTPDEAIPFAVGAKYGDPDQLAGGFDDVLRASQGVARRFGTRADEGLGAVAGRGLRPERSEFGIAADEFTPRDIEGLVLDGAEGTADELRALPGAPGHSSTSPGVARTRSERPGPGMEAVREAPTPYEYLKGMASDYERFRDFYPDFGRFYRSLAEPAGEQSEGLFNELGAMWAATAAQTAPHDNLIKALQASIAARKFRELTGKLPNQDELLYLLRTGEAAPGMRYDRVRANPKLQIEAKLDPVLGPEGVIAKVPEAKLEGGAAKITSDDAKKIAAIWEEGGIDIPTNFKLTAFNILNALAARNEHAPWSVIDTHMFRLFGYGDEARKIKAGDLAGNPTASRYVQATVKRLADELGWEPHQVQSALWYGAKNEISRVDVKNATMKGGAAEFAGMPEGTVVDDGTLAYSIQKAWDAGVLPNFLKNYAPQGPINEMSGGARVRFTGPIGPGNFGKGPSQARGVRLSGKDPVTGQKYGRFRLDMPEQEGANAWAENRGYTTTVDAGPQELDALGYDRDTGKIRALTERSIPHAVTENVDGSTSVQLFARADAPAQEAQDVLAGALGGDIPQMHRPILETQQGRLGPSTGQAFQLDKADGARWTLAEVQAARRSGLPIRMSPDGLSLVARADDLPSGTTIADLQRELEAAGAPPLEAQAVDVRTLPPRTQAPGAVDTVGAVAGEEGAGEAGDVQSALQRALASVQPYGAASTQGERTFDVAAGTAGGVAGAATADEDATWQERAKRFAVGSAGAALAGPTARGALGQLAGRSADTLGAAAGARGPRGGVPRQLGLGEAEGAGGLPKEARRLLTPGANGATKLGAATQLAQATPLASIPSLGWNAAGGVFRTAQRYLQDSAGNLDRPAESLSDLIGMGQELLSGRALKAGVREFNKVSERGASAQGLTPGGIYESTNPVLRGLTAGTRANAATDQFFRTLNEAGARARMARRGATGPEAAEGVTRAGDFASFLGKSSPVADALVSAGQWANNRDLPMAKRLLGAATAGFAPYVRTPERILWATTKLASDWATQPGQFAYRLAKGDKDAAREAGGRFLLSAGLVGLFANEYLSGALRGDPPANPTERRKAEADGAQWNTWRGMPISRIGPVGGAASIVATTLAAGERAVVRGEHPADVGRDTVNAIGRWTLSNSYLEDLQNFSEDVAAGRLAQAAEKQAVNVGTRALSPLTSIGSAIDPSERTREGTGEELLYKLPGGRFFLPERLDPTSGEPVRRKGNFASRYAGFSQGRETTPEGTELSRFGVNAPEYRAGDTYQGAPLTSAQARILQRASGSEINRATREVLASPEYKAADEAGKEKQLRAALTRARERADVVAGEQVSRGTKQQAQREYDAVPRYRGVSGTPDQIRTKNDEISQAKSARSKAKSKSAQAEADWIKAHPDEYRLSRMEAVDPARLKYQREQIEKKHGVELG